MKLLRVLLALAVAVLIVLTSWIGVSVAWSPISDLNVDAGKRLFKRRCASCHSVDGAKMSYGPDLSQIGSVAADRVDSLTAEEYLLQSILRPNAFRADREIRVMPEDIREGLEAREILNLVGFLMTLGGRLDQRRIVKLAARVPAEELRDTTSVDLETVEAGKQLFLTKAKCAACHRLQATPGFTLRAPGLLRSGEHSEQFLRESIRNPSARLTPGYEDYTVRLASGKLVVGRILNQGVGWNKSSPGNLATENPLRLLVDTPRGLQLVSFSLQEVEVDVNAQPWIRRSSVSRMPTGTSERLSPLEVDQIVAFLKSLR